MPSSSRAVFSSTSNVKRTMPSESAALAAGTTGLGTTVTLGIGPGNTVPGGRSYVTTGVRSSILWLAVQPATTTVASTSRAINMCVGVVCTFLPPTMHGTKGDGLCGNFQPIIGAIYWHTLEGTP